jgi:hypothetical protein
VGLQLAPFVGGTIFIDGTASAFARIDGTQYSALGIDTHFAVQGLASDGKTLYWFHDGVGAPDLTDGAMSSAPAVDGGAETVVKGNLESLESYGNAMALDDASVYFSAVVVPDGGINGEPHLFIVPR